MNSRDLKTLLASEIAKHVGAIESGATSFRQLLHAIKGSAGLAGETALADVLGRTERTFAASNAPKDERVELETLSLLKAAHVRLSLGESAIASQWPSPPSGIAPLSAPPSYYVLELKERLTRLDDALEAELPAPVRLTSVARELHTIKGAAGAVGDELVSWFVNGLEIRLKALNKASEDSAVRAELQLNEVVKYKSQIRGLIEEPKLALARLSTLPEGERFRSSSKAATATTTNTAAPLRVDPSTLDSLFDRLQALRSVAATLANKRSELRTNAKRSRDLRRDITDALRLIGPPRPWGAPAAAINALQECASELSELGSSLERAAYSVEGGSEALKQTTRAASKELVAIRQMSVRDLFRRIAQAAQTEARRLEKSLSIEMSGAEEQVDRRMLEGLFAPCMHIARNCVAHGIEDAPSRLRSGKLAQGRIRLIAKRDGARLEIAILDDGAGVNLTKIRERALAYGLAKAETQQYLEDDDLLSFLLVHGFSTKDRVDELSGAGVGLDAALSDVRSLGGTLRLENNAGQGFCVRISVPLDPFGFAKVLWVTANGVDYALPAPDVRHLEAREDATCVHLALCVEGKRSAAGKYMVAVNGGSSDTLIAVDHIGEIASVIVRPVSPLVARLGPFIGAVADKAGAVRFVLDPIAIAQRARLLAAS
jgi:two-component system, chemotaxis family, sensor kinase CheA